MDPLTQTYKDLSGKIFRFLLKRNGGDETVAQAVLQDTFVAAFKSYHTFRHKSSYFTWLCKISLSKLADYYRQQVHYRSRIVVPAVEQFNALIDPGLTAEEKLSLDELKNQVNRCLDLLPSRYRRLLYLKYYQSLSTKEICILLHISPRQLEGRLRRAKRSLAKSVSVVYPDLKR
jgi:RNA polymerase sigma-70 factor (ECF subfamily)